jgi:localization factor PodJL
MARLGENLADRVQQAELRSAAAVEQAGERMAQVVEKLETQHASETRARIWNPAFRRAKSAPSIASRRPWRVSTSASIRPAPKPLTPCRRFSAPMTALADRLEAIELRPPPRPSPTLI